MITNRLYLYLSIVYLTIGVFIDEMTISINYFYGAINNYLIGGISSNGLKANR